MSTSEAEPLVLHTCCGPCATGSVPAWRAEGLEPLALFCNPNIQPAAEYERRLVAAGQMATALEVRLEVAELAVDAAHPWLPAACATGSPPPAPDRCRSCIGARLRVAARRCAELGMPRPELRRFFRTFNAAAPAFEAASRSLSEEGPA